MKGNPIGLCCFFACIQILAHVTKLIGPLLNYLSSLASCQLMENQTAPSYIQKWSAETQKSPEHRHHS